MTFDPAVVRFVRGQQSIQFLPKIPVSHSLSGSRSPTVPLPSWNPFFPKSISLQELVMEAAKRERVGD